MTVTTTTDARPIGAPRTTWVVIVLYIVTLTIYGYYWWFKTHDEMKKYSGQGIGGLLALLLLLANWITSISAIPLFYITPSEVGKLYERDGQVKPLSGWAGLWMLPGIFIIVGPFIWIIKTQGALNRFWESKAATA